MISSQPPVYDVIADGFGALASLVYIYIYIYMCVCVCVCVCVCLYLTSHQLALNFAKKISNVSTNN